MLLAQSTLWFVQWRFAAELPEKMTYAVNASTVFQGIMLGVLISLIFSGMTPDSRVIRADAGFVLAYPLAVLDCTKVRAYHMPLKTIKLTLIAKTIITMRSQVV